MAGAFELDEGPTGARCTHVARLGEGLRGAAPIGDSAGVPLSLDPFEEQADKTKLERTSTIV